MYWAKKAKIDEYLDNLVEKGIIYVGVSAGSVLVTPDIGLTWWNIEDSDDHTGLGIVDFIVCVHQNENDEWTNTNNIRKRKKYL